VSTASETRSLPSIPSLAIALDPETIELLADAVAVRLAVRLPQPDKPRTGLNSAEAAAYIGISLETLRDLVACRKIASFQTFPGTPHSFDVEDLDAYRLQHRLEAVN
jgi:hypothetical protein